MIVQGHLAPQALHEGGHTMKPCRYLTFALVLIAAGCGRTRSVDHLKNRKVLDAILTAVTTHNLQQLNDGEILLDAGHAERRISDAHYQTLAALIALARSGEWTNAEEKLYEFREAHPYVQ